MDIATELDNYLGERKLLIQAIVREFRAGESAARIAAAVAPAFSRDVVKQFLSTVAMADSARKALDENGLRGMVGVSVSGIDAPRQALLGIDADPGQVRDYDDLPGRARAALRDFHLGFALPHGEPEPADVDLDVHLDDLLREGDRVRLVRLRPRT